MSKSPPVNPKPEHPDGTRVTRVLRHEDIEPIEAVLRHWVKDSDSGEIIEEEVHEILGQMAESIDGDIDRQYVVAQAESGRVIGVMGIAIPGKEVRPYAQTENPAEIVNAFVAADQRGQGVGRLLLASLEQLALPSGFTELIVSSGPRYKDTGWAFYNSLFGSPVAILKDRFGPGRDAPVWRKVLVQEP